MTKSQLRQVFKSKRAALSKVEVTEKSKEIAINFIQNLLPKIYQKNSNKTFGLYLGAHNEVSTDFIAEYFKENNIRFGYSKIVAPDQPLEFVEFKEGQEFQPSAFFPKILEAIAGKKITPDFLIMPLLAFDLDLCRLGMGGGFFDRTIYYLKSQNLPLITIGLGYEFQRSDELLPIENTDQTLDFIVTEKNIFS